jgi:hypothetical protein
LVIFALASKNAGDRNFSGTVKNITAGRINGQSRERHKTRQRVILIHANTTLLAIAQCQTNISGHIKRKYIVIIL